MILVSNVFILSFFVALLFFFYRFIINPIKKLHEGVEIIGAGNLGHQIEVKSRDEIGQVARSFNEMAEKLHKSYSGLEEKVAERTKQLYEKAEELERTNKLMVGRELKMIELKEEIKKLKGNK